MLLIASFAMCLALAAVFGLGVAYVLAAHLDRRLQALEYDRSAWAPRGHAPTAVFLNEVDAFLRGQP